MMNAARKSSVLVAGSANLDFIVRAPHIPAPGETVLGGAFTTLPGGKGANQAVACARAGGATTHMLVALGSDAFAEPIEASLNEAGVNLHLVRSSDPTGTAFICVSDAAENAITVAPGANATLQPSDLPDLDGVSHLLVQLETPLETVASWVVRARVAGVRILLNAAPASALPTHLLETIDVLVVNEGELAMVAGCDGNVATCLARIGVPTVVVTLGARGCCARADGRFYLQPAFAIDAVDTTGAGDTFCGVLAAAMDRGAQLPHALREASAAAALACQRIGAQASIPTAIEVDAFLHREASSQNRKALAELAAYCGFE